jgi:5-(carboxyamino)imidazole ribonucleotide synthase
MGANEQIKNVGILGGGQLGCMLADAALALGLEPRIYAEASSPAASIFADRTVTGSMSDESALRDFFSQVRVVAFENEFLDCDLLERAARGLSLRFSPSLDSIRRLQDKLEQKKLLVELGLPTADYDAILPDQRGTRARDAIDRAYQRFEGQVVFKWSRMGYDGKGVCLAREGATGRAEALAFCEPSLERGVAVYAERKIAFRRELAIIACRSITGEFKAYPLVTSRQERGICKLVLGPATQLGAPAALESQAREAARRLAESMKLEGSFALELFETPEGKLAINEIAPRVHNSGHYSQDACPASQFENHWRALLGMPFGETRASGGFGMLNLLGPEGIALRLPQRRTELPFPPVPEPIRLHWYAKAEVRPWRKVGHLNAVCADASELKELEAKLDKYQQSWVDRLHELQDHRSPSK